MGALSAAVAPATFDSSAYLSALLEERTQGRMPDRDEANIRFRHATGERVMSRRRELGYNRDKLAALCGVTSQAVAKWEREGLPLDRLTAVAEVLEVSPEWLLHGDSPRLADLHSQLEALSAQVAMLMRLVARPESDQEKERSRPA